MRGASKPLVFLKIPKNAGSSFARAFPTVAFTRHSESFPRSGQVNIAIVRNPGTRLQSIFAHLKDRSQDPAKSFCSDVREFSSLQALAEAYFNPGHRFHRKARYLFNWNEGENLESYNYAAGCSKKRCIHWAPQSFFINENHPPVDYLLRLERLAEDIKALQYLGVLGPGQIGTRNVSPQRYKSMAQMTALVSRLVRHVYAQDFALWRRGGMDQGVTAQ